MAGAKSGRLVEEGRGIFRLPFGILYVQSLPSPIFSSAFRRRLSLATNPMPSEKGEQAMEDEGFVPEVSHTTRAFQP